MTGAESQWFVANSAQFTDKRMMFKRTGMVNYAVSAYRAVIVRRGVDGKAEYDRCYHAHVKPSTARKCAEASARRRNRREKGEGW